MEFFFHIRFVLRSEIARKSSKQSSFERPMCWSTPDLLDILQVMDLQEGVGFDIVFGRPDISHSVSTIGQQYTYLIRICSLSDIIIFVNRYPMEKVACYACGGSSLVQSVRHSVSSVNKQAGSGRYEFACETF